MGFLFTDFDLLLLLLGFRLGTAFFATTFFLRLTTGMYRGSKWKGT
jgi:hypothetical protein